MQFNALLFLCGLFYCYGFNINELLRNVIRIDTIAPAGDCHHDNFHPVSDSMVRFQVRTEKDAHIALFEKQQNSDPWIEVLIERWAERQSAITKNGVENIKVKVETPKSLNKTEFIDFWVSWDRGNISVGYEYDGHFMSWQDPEPFNINYVAFCTGFHSNGTWLIKSGLDIPLKLGGVVKPPLILLPVHIELYRWPEIKLQNETKSYTKYNFLR